MGDRLGIHNVIDILSKHAESVAKVLSEVGYEPRPSYEGQNSPSTSYGRSKGRHVVWRLRPLGRPDIS